MRKIFLPSCSPEEGGSGLSAFLMNFVKLIGFWMNANVWTI